MIVACNITFDEIITGRHGERRSYWSLAQWRFLLDDLVANQLRYPGRLYFKLNKQPRGHMLGFQRLSYNHDLLAMAANNGGTVSHWRGIIEMGFPSPREIRLPGRGDG